MTGWCHICKSIATVYYCAWCEHYFCRDCQYNFFWRGWEAIKERYGGKKPGCCGTLPVEGQENG